MSIKILTNSKMESDLSIEKKYQLLLEENQRLRNEIIELKLKYEPITYSKSNITSYSSPQLSNTLQQQSITLSTSPNTQQPQQQSYSPHHLSPQSSTATLSNYPISSSSSQSSSEDLKSNEQITPRGYKKDRSNSGGELTTSNNSSNGSSRDNSKSDKSKDGKDGTPTKKPSTSVGKKWINKLLDPSKKLSTSNNGGSSSGNLNSTGATGSSSGGSSSSSRKHHHHNHETINHQELINGTSGNEADFIYQEKGLSTPYINLPKLEVIPVAGDGNKLSYFTGPDYAPVNPSDVVTTTGSPMITYPSSYTDRLYCISTSTYPFLPNTTQRAGDPIADRYTCAVYNNRLIVCLADGCNWGQKPKEAAQNAGTAFIDYVISQNDNMTNVKEVGKILFNAFECAHKSIMVGKDEFWEAGTTTLLGGVLLEINKGSDKWSPQWEFVCASVGDCKAFLLSQGEVTDITEGNRSNLDAKDCGGRLGPHLEQGKPDLRNLNIFCASVYDEDIIMLVSDGVHDNLDPRHLGKMPNEMSKEFNLSGEKWSDVDFSKAQIAKNAFTASLLETITADSTDPSEISNRILEHCWNTTTSSRYFMESNVGKRLPEDYARFPGKMDHTSIICFKVGNFSKPTSTTPTVIGNHTSPIIMLTDPNLNSISGEPFSSINSNNNSIASTSKTPPTVHDWIKVSPSHNNKYSTLTSTPSPIQNNNSSGGNSPNIGTLKISDGSDNNIC